MNDHRSPTDQDNANDEVFKRAFHFNLQAGTATQQDIAIAKKRGWI